MVGKSHLPRLNEVDTSLRYIQLMLSILFIAQGLLVLTLIVRDGVSRRVEIASARNLFLIGFVVFQSFSAATAMTTGLFGEVPVRTPLPTGFLFFILTSVALAIFLRTWRKSKIAAKASSLPAKLDFKETSSLWLMSFICLGFGLISKFVLVFVPIFGVLSVQLATGMFAASVGLAAWQWSRSPWNAANLLLFLAISVVVIGAMLSGAFGRRPLLTVMLVIGFAYYWRVARYKDPRQVFTRAFFLALIVSGPMILFTAARKGSERERSASDFVSAVASIQPSDISKSIISLLSGQDTAANSMWIIENMGDRYPHDYAHSVRYLLLHPIPRAYFPTKPDGLGHTMVKDAGIPKKPKNFTVGPGFVGHIWNDWPYLCIFIYPWLVGILVKFLDTILIRYTDSPLPTMLASVTMAQVTGLPRGELSLFIFNGASAFLGAYLAFRFGILLMPWIKKRIKRSSGRNKLEPWKEWSGTYN